MGILDNAKKNLIFFYIPQIFPLAIG